MPIIILCYGFVQYPRCQKGFWRFAIGYTIAVVVLKFMFQISIFCITTDDLYSISPDPDCIDGITRPYYSSTTIFGLYKYQDWVSFGGTSSFLGMIFFEIMCLVAMARHRLLLIHNGIWWKSPNDLGDSTFHDIVPFNFMIMLIF